MSASRAGPATHSGVNLGSELSDEVVAFGLAMEAYMRGRRRPFPSWGEVLSVAKSLGYELVAKPKGLPVAPTEPPK